MLYSVYTVKDITAQEFGPPFIAVNDGIAKRQFIQMNIPPALLKEYELYMIGLYDSNTGEIIPELNYKLEIGE